MNEAHKNKLAERAEKRAQENQVKYEESRKKFPIVPAI